MWPRAYKKWDAGIHGIVSEEAPCGRVHIKNGTRASHPVWDFKNLKGGRGGSKVWRRSRLTATPSSCSGDGPSHFSIVVEACLHLGRLLHICVSQC